MNEKLEKCYMVLSFVLISTASLATYGGMAQLPDATAQNVTTAANQTGAELANQTAAPAQNQITSPFGNLTSAWLDPVRENLQSARGSLQVNDTLSAYSLLSMADIQLLAIASDPAIGVEKTTLMQKFKPLSDGIDSAQAAIQSDDINGALNGLNTLDLEFFKLNQQLPPAQAEEEAEEEEED
jgi:hypothetical protein